MCVPDLTEPLLLFFFFIQYPIQPQPKVFSLSLFFISLLFSGYLILLSLLYFSNLGILSLGTVQLYLGLSSLPFTYTSNISFLRSSFPYGYKKNIAVDLLNHHFFCRFTS